MTNEELENLKNRVKENLALINNELDKIEDENAGLIDFIIYLTIDRILLYLNSETVPTIVERLIVDVVNNGLNRVIDTKNNKGNSQVVSSISDNGQSISYATEVRNYFTSSTDNEMFGSFTGVLSRYRRVRVVNI